VDVAAIQAQAAQMPTGIGSVTTGIPLGNKAFATPYYSLGAEICQNMYLENASTEFSKSPYYLIKIPGLRRFNPTPSSVNYGACRGFFTSSGSSSVGSRTFVVNGTGFYELFQDGTRNLIGSLSTLQGRVGMAENGAQLMLVDGEGGYIFDYAHNDWRRITDEYFPGNDPSLGTLAPNYVDCIDTYFIVNVPGTNTYYWSTPGYTSDLDNTSISYWDAVTAGEVNGFWNPLQSGQKIGKPENINCLINCNNYLWLGGLNSFEVHYDTGNYNGQQFARYQGAILNVGCSAPNSVAVYQNSIFFLGTDKNGTLGVFSNDGMNPVRISTPGIDQLIEKTSGFTDCIGYTYAQNSHAFYVMQFPTGNRTFVYDMVTQSWHERTRLNSDSGLLMRWDGLYATRNWSKVVMGDASTSEVYSLDASYYQNDNPLSTTGEVNYIRCVKTTPISFSSGKQQFFNWVQVICSQGGGLSVNTAAGVGQDPRVQIAWSNDSGVTYSNERSAPIGKQGEYAKRSIVWIAGMGRNRVWRIAMTDPVPFLLVALYVNGRTGKF
jgi:hypothetical protein